MKKDNILLYDGGFIDYEHWNAPIIIDLSNISFSSDEPVIIGDGTQIGQAYVWDCTNTNHPVELRTDVDIMNVTQFGVDAGDKLKLACDIVVQEGKFIEPGMSIEINKQHLTTHNEGAWLITRARLQAVTVTTSEKPRWIFDREYEAQNLDIKAPRKPIGEKPMDDKMLKQCAEVLQKANNQSTEKLEAEFTAEELKDFANGKTHLSVPLVYEDEDGKNHNVGEIILSLVTYGPLKTQGIIFQTYCFPMALRDIPNDAITMIAKFKNVERRSNFNYQILFMKTCDYGVGFGPITPGDCSPINVTFTRKTNAMARPVVKDDAMSDSQKKIAETCDAIKNLLLEKNRKYGDSALNPVRVFSKTDKVEQLKVRMDDKLSRIKNEQGDEDEDVYMDLAGYLVLMLIAKEEQKEQKETQA